MRICSPVNLVTFNQNVVEEWVEVGILLHFSICRILQQFFNNP
jgi:hypothetical protein